MRYFWASILFLFLFCDASSARKVTGRVVCEKESLSGVIVTDGANFTQTNEKGAFSFEIQDDAEFVYIVTPAGYAADWSTGVPAFYQVAKGKKKFIFNLKKIGTDADYSIVAVADPQTRGKGHFAKFKAEPMSDLCQTASSLGNKAVGLLLGDICWDSLDMIEPFKAEITRTGIPFYPVVGNHDHDKDARGDKETTAAYRSLMGPENYAFRLGKDLVIVVDNIIYDTGKKYTNGFAPHVLAWVKGLMELIPADAYVYVAQHAPLHVWDKGIKAENAAQLIDLIDEHQFCFLSGHTHINNNLIHEGGAFEHNIAAICGSWWDTKHCTDGTPRGYKVFSMQDGELFWYYKSVDHPKDYQVQIFRKGESTLFPDSILINIWDWDPQWKVSWYQDGTYMGELQTVQALSPEYLKEITYAQAATGEKTPKFKQPRKNYHYFAVTPSEDVEKIKIHVRSRFGQIWVYEINCK